MTTRPTVRAANGLVASGHHLATAAGLAALRDGGSAADAAVTAAAVCAVVLPQRTSIGGDLFALVYDARAREVSAFNASGAAPRSLALDRFVAGYPEQGAIVATVPGVLGGWAELLADHGRLGLERALAPAIASSSSRMWPCETGGWPNTRRPRYSTESGSGRSTWNAARSSRAIAPPAVATPRTKRSARSPR